MSIFRRTGGSKSAVEAKAFKLLDSTGHKLVKNNYKEFTYWEFLQFKIP